MSDLDIGRVRARAARLATWHHLSWWIALISLTIFGSLWLRTYWIWIGPQLWLIQAGQRVTTPAIFLSGLGDALLAVGLALASATVPAIFLSGLIPNSPAATLLSDLDRRYGRPGYIFAIIGAAVFSALGFQVLLSYWTARSLGGTLTPTEVWTQTFASLFLMVGFPAWALNRMTPEQWIDAILQAREVARIKHIIELEDMAEKAIIARARALLYADVAGLTLAQRAANNREVAAILAAAERGMYASLQQVGETFRSLYHMDLVTRSDDAAITARYKFLADSFGTAADELDAHHTTVVDWVPPALAARAPVAQPDAETGARAVADASETAGRGGTAAALDAPARTLLAVAQRTLGTGAWKRADLERTLQIEKTKALELIRVWTEAGELRSLTDPKFHYAFAGED